MKHLAPPHRSVCVCRPAVAGGGGGGASMGRHCQYYRDCRLHSVPAGQFPSAQAVSRARAEVGALLMPPHWSYASSSPVLQRGLAVIELQCRTLSKQCWCTMCLLAAILCPGLVRGKCWRLCAAHAPILGVHRQPSCVKLNLACFGSCGCDFRALGLLVHVVLAGQLTTQASSGHALAWVAPFHSASLINTSSAQSCCSLQHV